MIRQGDRQREQLAGGKPKTEMRRLLLLFALSAVILTASCFTLNESTRQKRTVMIPPQILEPLVPILQKILPEAVLAQIQALLTMQKLVAVDDVDATNIPSTLPPDYDSQERDTHHLSQLVDIFPVV